jgi:lipoprotein NlpI
MLPLLLWAISLTCPIAQAEQPRDIFDQAVSDFRRGRIEESVAGFDRLVKLAPNALPQLWQRGIALYYAGRFKDCRAQFESHRTVNPNDVENAAWHFLCVARAESPAKAKAALLPVGPDSRVPMSQIYQMFRGELTVEQVLKAGGAQLESQFYAELYSGLYLEALGNPDEALKHIRNAAADRYSGSGYMHDVARVHRDRLVGPTAATKP